MIQLQNVLPQISIHDSSLLIILLAIAAFFILWIIASIPVWISAKLLRAKHARFGRAMLVTAVGPIAYWLVYTISANLFAWFLPVGYFYHSVSIVKILAIAIAFVASIYVFKKGFGTGWIRALGIAAVSIAVFVIIGVVLALVFNHLFLPPQQATITSIPFQQV